MIYLSGKLGQNFVDLTYSFGHHPQQRLEWQQQPAGVKNLILLYILTRTYSFRF